MRVYSQVTFSNLRGQLPGTLPIQSDGGGPYWWPPNDLNVRAGPPNEGMARRVAKTLRSDLPAFLNIESWVLCNGLGEVQELRSLEYFIQVARWVRAEKRELRFGFWNVPGTTGWANILTENAWWTWCVDSHRRLRPLAEHVDFLAPGLYAGDEQWWPWRRTTEAMLDLYRRMGKPLWCFISPRVQSGQARRLLPDDALAMQIEFLSHQQVEAVVIWDDLREAFNPRSGWWQSAAGVIGRVAGSK